MSQQVLVISTHAPNMRSVSTGWTAECAFMATLQHQPKLLLALLYKTPIDAMADDWTLMGPPVNVNTNRWDWYFQRYV